MRITFVGSGGSVVTRRRSCSCILINDELLIDCGCGALKNLRALNVNLHNIKYVLITHFHMDHISDLIGLFWSMRMDHRTSPLTIVTPPKGELKVRSLLELMETPKDFLTFNLNFIETTGGTITSSIKACRVSHSVPTLAYRVEINGKSVCYSGDTRPSINLIRLAKNANLLIHEASFTHDNVELAYATWHSTALQAGEIACKAGVKRLALFHIYDGNEDKLLAEAKRSFKGEVIVAEDLQSITI